MKKNLLQNNYNMLQNRKAQKRTKIWKIKLMRQMWIKIAPATDTEVNNLKNLKVYKRNVKLFYSKTRSYCFLIF